MPGSPGRLHPNAGRRRKRWPRNRQAAAHAGLVASERHLHREPAAIVCYSHSFLPVAAVERHHPLIPLATQGLHHPIAAYGLHHSVIPLAAVERHHPVLPHAATSGLTHHHAVLPLAAIERHHPVIPLATFPRVTHHAILPDTTLKLQHAILPLAATRRTDPVPPVAAVRLLHNSSSNNNTRAAPADVRRRARRAVRAATDLLQPEPHNATNPLPRFAVASLHGVPPAPVLRPPHHAVGTNGGTPRLRPAAARPGDRDPLVDTVAPHHPLLGNAVVLALLAAAFSGREPRHRHRRAPSGRRQAAVPTGVRRVVRVAAAAGEAVLLNHLDRARPRCLAVAGV